MPPYMTAAFNSADFPVPHLLSALESFNIGVGVVDKRLRFRTVNRALATMNCVPKDAHPGTPLHIIVGDLATRLGALSECVLRTGQEMPHVEISGQLPNRLGPGRWMDYLFPILDHRGRVTQVGAIVFELKSGSILENCFDRTKSSPSNPNVPHPSIRTLGPAAPGHSECAGGDRSDVVLSGREQEILKSVATGKSNKEISSILGISVRTVECYRWRMMHKLRAPSLAHLVHYAISHGIVDLDTRM